MRCVNENLPDPRSGESWAEEAAIAFEAIDRDNSGELDYEEFVAVMSGMRTSPYEAS